ncbi:hypothetical protein [Mesorhizobium sp. M0772]|uniref:hypothetical protein n=1 Tax=Mesorhizobium sp. M0772 TaxID=2956998 RepID=UPI003337E1FF
MSVKPAVKSSILVIALVSMVQTLSACVSTPPPAPEQMSRTQVETAPADLQLLCANAVAKSSGADSAKILPMSSSRIDSKTYQVELDAGGKKTSCLVDTDGTVKSVEPI